MPASAIADGLRRIGAGESVVAGAVLGSVGDSAGHGQPALYFEVRRGKTPVDPQTWLTRK